MEPRCVRIDSGEIKKGQPAYKPGSVLHRRSGGASVIYLGLAVADRLCAVYPPALGGQPLMRRYT